MDISLLSLDNRLQNIIAHLFGIEDASFRDALLNNASIIELDGGDTLFKKGEESDHMYILISGRHHAAVDEEGDQKIVGEIGIGETVGEMALITGEPRSAEVFAIRDSILLDIDKTSFEELVKTYPQALWNITKLVIQRLNKSINTPKHNISHDNFAFINLASDQSLIGPFINDIIPGIMQLGSVYFIDENTVASHFDTSVEEMDFTRSNHLLTAWITEMEKKHDYLIMAGSKYNESWTKRCLRQADKIIIVGSPSDLVQLHPIEERLLQGEHKISGAEQELLIIHPSGSRPKNTKAILELRAVKRHFHIESGNRKHIARFLRIMSDTSNGLVLSGGGAKGHAHVGIYQALEESEIPIDYVGGTSIGSIMAGFIAMGYNAQRLHDEARSVFMSNPTPSSEYNWLPVFCLISGQKLQGLLEHYFGDIQIEDLWLPFYCISSNLTNAKMHIHESGSLAKAIRASISLPGIFPPAIHEKSLLVDGAIFNNFPIDVMVEKSVGNIIAVSLNSDTEQEVDFQSFPNRGKYLWNKLRGGKDKKLNNIPNMMHTLVQSTLVNSDALARTWRSSIDLFFNPDVTQFGLMDWKSFDKIAGEGYKHGQEVLRRTKNIDQFRNGKIAKP